MTKPLLIIIFLLIFCNTNAQSEIAQPENLKGLIYDYPSKELKGSLPFDEFTYLLVKKGKSNFYPLAFIYEFEYVTEPKSNIEDESPCDKYNKNIKNKKVESSLIFDGSKKVRKPIYKTEWDNEIKSKEFDSKEELNCFISKKRKNPFEIHKKESLSNNRYLLKFKEGTYIALHKLMFQSFGEDGKSLKAIIPPLEPNKLYEIVINRKLNDKELSKMYKYFEIYMNDDKEINGIKPRLKAEQYYIKEIISLESRLVTRINNLSIFPEKHSDFVKFLLSKKLTYSINKESLPKIKRLDNIHYPSESEISIIGNKIKENELNLKLYTKWMSLFLNSNKKQVASIFDGSNYPNSKLPDYNKLTKNLKKNVDSLNLLKFELDKLLILDTTNTVKIFYTDFYKKFHKDVKDNYESFKSYNDLVKEETNTALGVSELLSISTRGKTLKTSNAKVLIPDFGFVNAFAHNQNGNIKYLARPYFGLNFHFQGINKDQRLKEIIDKKFRHRFSLSIGVTIGKIETEGYTDFFNGISPTVGINYRATRQVRFGIGTMLLRENDVNPILNESRVQIAPYASLSFDFGLFEQAGKLVGKIF